MNFCSTRRRALDVQDVQAALEHAHESALLVIRGHQLARLRIDLHGQLEFARLFGDIGQIDRQQLAILRGLDLRFGDDFCGAVRHLHVDADGDRLIDVAADFDLAVDRHFGLDEDRGRLGKVDHRHVLDAAQAARLAKDHGKDRVVLVPQAGGSVLGRSIARGDRLLPAVSQQHDPQQMLAVLLVEQVVQGRADSRLLALWDVREDDLAVLHFPEGMRLAIKRIGSDLEIAAHIASAGTQSSKVASSESQRVLLLRQSRTSMLRDWSTSSTNVASSLWLCV